MLTAWVIQSLWLVILAVFGSIYFDGALDIPGTRPCGAVRYVAVNYSRLVLKHKGSMCVFSSPPPPPPPPTHTHTPTHIQITHRRCDDVLWCVNCVVIHIHVAHLRLSPSLLNKVYAFLVDGTYDIRLKIVKEKAWINMHEVVVALTNWFHCSMNIWLFILDRKHTFILRTIMHNLRINAFAEM